MAVEESLIKGLIDLFADTAIIRYGDIRFKEYYEMSRGHEHDQLKYSLSLYISREKGHQKRKPRSQRSLLRALPMGWLGENPGYEVAKHGTTIFFPLQSYSKRA